jgi:hypothetical protein
VKAREIIPGWPRGRSTDIHGIPIIVNSQLAAGTIALIDRNTRHPWIQVDKMQTLVDAIDDDFLRRCGIVTGLGSHG